MPRLIGYRMPTASAMAWNTYCDAVFRGSSDRVCLWYRERYERIRQAEFDAGWSTTKRAVARSVENDRKSAFHAGWSAACSVENERKSARDPVAIQLAPRQLTSSSLVKLSKHGPAAATLTAAAFLFATTPWWGLCVVAPLIIYVWWLVTRETIEAAARLDEHPIPPARVLSEGPR